MAQEETFKVQADAFAKQQREHEAQRLELERQKAKQEERNIPKAQMAQGGADLAIGLVAVTKPRHSGSRGSNA